MGPCEGSVKFMLRLNYLIRGLFPTSSTSARNNFIHRIVVFCYVIDLTTPT